MTKEGDWNSPARGIAKLPMRRAKLRVYQGRNPSRRPNVTIKKKAIDEPLKPQTTRSPTGEPPAKRYPADTDSDAAEYVEATPCLRSNPPLMSMAFWRSYSEIASSGRRGDVCRSLNEAILARCDVDDEATLRPTPIDQCKLVLAAERINLVGVEC